MRPADFALLILLGAIWGASFLFMRIAVPALGPMWLVVVRIGSGAVFLLIAALVLRRALHMQGNIRHFLILGFFNTGLPFLLFAYAATVLSASLLSIINSTAPLWGALIGAALTRQAPGWRVMAGLGVGSAGVALLVLKNASAVAAPPLPVLAAIAAPLCYGIASHYARLKTPHLPPLAAAHGSIWGALLCLAPGTLISAVPALPSPDIGAAALALGVLCTGMAYLIYFRLIRDVGATSALTVTFLIPLFGIFWGVVFLGEPFGPPTVFGALIVLLGTALVTGFNPLKLLLRRGT